MNSLAFLQQDAVRIALIVIAAIFVIWLAQKLLRWALIFLIVGFLIWHFWLS